MQGSLFVEVCLGPRSKRSEAGLVTSRLRGKAHRLSVLEWREGDVTPRFCSFDPAIIAVPAWLMSKVRLVDFKIFVFL